MLVKSVLWSTVVDSRLSDEIGRRLGRGFELHIGEDQVGGLVAADKQHQHNRDDQRELDQPRRPTGRARELPPSSRLTPPSHVNGSFWKMTVDVNAAVPVPVLDPRVPLGPVQHLPPLKHAPTQGTMKGRG